jgi:hypothetical protein
MAKQFNVSLSLEDAAELESAARKLGMKPIDLIRFWMREGKKQSEMEKRLVHLEMRLETVLLLLEASLADGGFIRGAIELQASSNERAMAKGKEQEDARSRLARKLREKVTEYEQTIKQ